MPNEALVENTTAATPVPDKLVFRRLPGYARFIRENHLVPYILEHIRISRETNLPVLKFIEGISDEELLAMGMVSHTEFLTAAEHNTLKHLIEKNLQKWVDDQLVIMRREDLTAEDITLSGYIRKKGLMKFLPAYTTDVNAAMELIDEIDIFSTESATIATNIYIQLLKDRIAEQTSFTEVLSNTTPGLNYIFDIKGNILKYANKNMMRFFGYTLEDLKGMDNSIIGEMVYPGDVAATIAELEKCANAADDEVVSWELRLKAADSEYVWMRNYSSVFKRNADGEALEIVGIVLDVSNEKETAEQLLKREKQLLDAQAQTNMGSFELDIAANTIEVTPQFREIYEIQGKINPEELFANVHPDDAQFINTHRNQAIAENSTYDNEYRYLVNGKEKVIWARRIVTEKNGRKIMTGTVMDVTSRNKMLEQLRVSEQRYKQAQEISHAGTWNWDLVTGKIEWTDALYNIYGIPLGTELHFDDIIAYSDPADAPQIKKRLKNTLETLQPSETYYHITLKDGTRKILHAKSEAIADKAGKAYKVIGVIQDVTERQQLIEQLQHNETQLKDYQEFIEKITDVTPSIITAYNIHTGKYSFVNDALEKLLGYPAIKAIEEGVPFFMSILHPDDLPAIMEKNAQALDDANQMAAGSDEPIAEFKYRMKNSDGAYRWFHTYGTVFERNEKGLVESVLNISIDITDQEAAEQALYQKNIQLQQSNTSLEEYAYVTSHDLKEPLRKITTFTDRILTTQHEGLNDEVKTYFNKIIDASKRMQTMINDLLFVSTISGNKAFETCNLKSILEQAMIPLEQKIEENNALIESDDLPMAWVVASQFRQFARKDVAGKIKITHKFLNYNAAERYELTKAKKYLQVQLEDNGIGFENEYAAKIFAIFQRLHGKSEYDGSGIGLSICKRIVENHGGVIFAQGTVNQGAVFTIIIPA
jgi:PAS domain S-box-containing protein